jgi:glutaminyl-peptide cyclotransferase
VLLELARVVDLSAVDGSVWLVFFDAEDNGRLDGWDWIVGSRRFAESLDFQPEYVIVVDMIGDADQSIYLEANSDPVLQDHIWKIAARLGYADYFIPEVRHSMLDDHTPFLERGITAVDIIDFDYPYWHTVSDTADKVSAESLERVGRTLETLLESGGAYEPAAAE